VAKTDWFLMIGPSSCVGTSGDPPNAGYTAAEWVVDTSGRVRGIQFVEDTLQNNEFIQCLNVLLANTKFPPPSAPCLMEWPFLHYRDAAMAKEVLLQKDEYARRFRERRGISLEESPGYVEWTTAENTYLSLHEQGDAKCRKDVNCAIVGQCFSNDKGDCVAGASEDCLRSRVCESSGRCSLVGGRCTAASNEDCIRSKFCEKQGKCSLFGGKCSVTVSKDCEDSYICMMSGRCTANNGECVVGSTADCRRSYDCDQYDKCVLYDGACTSAEDVLSEQVREIRFDLEELDQKLSEYVGVTELTTKKPCTRKYLNYAGHQADKKAVCSAWRKALSGRGARIREAVITDFCEDNFPVELYSLYCNIRYFPVSQEACRRIVRRACW